MRDPSRKRLHKMPIQMFGVGLSRSKYHGLPIMPLGQVYAKWPVFAKVVSQNMLVQRVFVKFFKTILIFRKENSCFEMLLLQFG